MLVLVLVPVLVAFGLGGDWTTSIARQSIETMRSSSTLPSSCSSASYVEEEAAVLLSASL
ncbi:MAG: hypothetical protein K0S65_6639, partial [Labilithrix sp.]|nr:hypothetical protein [Labilithrix sp.]